MTLAGRGKLGRRSDPGAGRHSDARGPCDCAARSGRAVSRFPACAAHADPGDRCRLGRSRAFRLSPHARRSRRAAVRRRPVTPDHTRVVLRGTDRHGRAGLAAASSARRRQSGARRVLAARVWRALVPGCRGGGGALRRAGWCRDRRSGGLRGRARRRSAHALRRVHPGPAPRFTSCSPCERSCPWSCRPRPCSS